MQLRSPFAFALSVVFALAAQAPAHARPDCYVVTVGLNRTPGQKSLTSGWNNARMVRDAFRKQEGIRFGKVHTRTLLDQNATSGNIRKHWDGLTERGKVGDFMVLFLSGHGGLRNGGWRFCGYDRKNRLHDRQILKTADKLALQGKKVIIIVGSCHSGRLVTRAKPYLSKHRNPYGGGIAILAACRAQETAASLRKKGYSAFPKAVADGLTGRADANRDGTITLDELRRYAYGRGFEIANQSNRRNRQHSVTAWSPSMSGNLPLAMSP